MGDRSRQADGQAGESRHFVVNDLNYVDDTRRKSRIIIKGNHRDETHFPPLFLCRGLVFRW